MPTLTAGMLRALAEAADSHRGHTVQLVRNADGELASFAIVLSDGTSVGSARRDDGRVVVLELRTDDEEPKFVPRSKLTLMSEPHVRMVKHPKKGIDHADAVFRSLAAVEKFVVPYYVRFKTAAEVREMRDTFAKDTTALAVCHLPDSVEDKLEAGALVALIEEHGDGHGLATMDLDSWVKSRR